MQHKITTATLVLLMTTMLCLFGCSADTPEDTTGTDDPFSSSVGSQMSKEKTGKPSATAMSETAAGEASVIYLTNPASNKFIALMFVSNLMDPIETPKMFLGDDIVWNNAGTVKDGPGNWENRSTGNTFYVIYASCFCYILHFVFFASYFY